MAFLSVREARVWQQPHKRAIKENQKKVKKMESMRVEADEIYHRPGNG